MVNQKWEAIPEKTFKGLYEISSNGDVRTVPYSLFVGKELKEIKSVVLKQINNSVFLTLHNISGWHNVGALYYQTFGSRMNNEKSVR